MRSTGLAAALLAAILALAAPVPAAGAGGGVLVVGDSLAELTSPYLQRYLPSVELTVDAVGGTNSYQIYDRFERSYDPSQSVIVFDAGTNDTPAYPEILAGNLQKVTEVIGDRCMVVPTVHGYTVNGVDNTGKNRVVREFAGSRPGTQTPDWAGAVAAHPELMQADGLHPTQGGAELRAQLIAQGILGCLAGESAATSTSEKRETRPRPELETVSRFKRRQDALIEAIGGDLIRRLASGLFG
jgi:lysophospholipase L1-like esterase